MQSIKAGVVPTWSVIEPVILLGRERSACRCTVGAFLLIRARASACRSTWGPRVRWPLCRAVWVWRAPPDARCSRLNASSAVTFAVMSSGIASSGLFLSQACRLPRLAIVRTCRELSSRVLLFESVVLPFPWRLSNSRSLTCTPRTVLRKRRSYPPVCDQGSPNRSDRMIAGVDAPPRKRCVGIPGRTWVGVDLKRRRRLPGRRRGELCLQPFGSVRWARAAVTSAPGL